MSPLKRARHPMPGFVQTALRKRGLLGAYRLRPAYQRNDYLGWIMRAKLSGTRERRLHQMLTELQLGGIYMGMTWNPAKKK